MITFLLASSRKLFSDFVKNFRRLLHKTSCRNQKNEKKEKLELATSINPW